MSQQSTETAAQSKRSFNWRRWLLWLAVIDTLISIALTVLTVASGDALAGLAHYDGFGYVAMMIALTFVAFIISVFQVAVGNIVIGGGLGVLVLVIAFFYKKGSSPQKGEATTTSDTTDSTSD